MRRAPLPHPLPSLDYLATLSDDVGIIQHASEDIPNRATGYCTDDVARAFVVALARLALPPNGNHEHLISERLASTYLSFLHNAQRGDGRFHNFMGYERAWLDEVGTPDCNGRAILALGYGMRFAPRESWRRLCGTMLGKALEAMDWLEYSHSKAYTAIGLAHAHLSIDDKLDEFRTGSKHALERCVNDLCAKYEKTRSQEWEWFEDVMTYDNARLCEAVLRAGFALHNSRYVDVGLRTFRFYLNVTIENGIYVPIGNHHWYRRGGERSRYAQQPLEAAALVDAAYAARDCVSDPAYDAAAQLGLEWFYGRNTRTAWMAHGGGCYDGLEEDGINRNMGAESTLAYLLSAFTVAARHQTDVLHIAQ